MEPHQYSEPCNAKRIQSQCPPRVSSRDEGRFPPSHLGSAAHCTVNSGAVAERRGMRLTEHHVSWVSENQMTEDCSTRHQVATVKREPKEAQNGHAARQSQHDVTFAAAAAAAAAAPSTSACTSLAAGEVLGCNPQLTSGSVNGSKRHWDATSASCGARSKTGQGYWKQGRLVAGGMANGKKANPASEERPASGSSGSPLSPLDSDGTWADRTLYAWQLTGSSSSLDDVSLASTASESAPLVDCTASCQQSPLPCCDSESPSQQRSHLSILLQPPRQLRVQSGGSIVLRIEVEDSLRRPVSCQWYRDRQPLPSQTQNILVVHDATPSQSGSYSCVAYVTERLLLLDCDPRVESILSCVTAVEVLQDRKDESPRITRQPQSLLAVYGSRVEVVCEADAHPPPSFKWHLNGVWLQDQTKAAMIVDRCTEANCGTYTCVVTNSLGSKMSKEADIRVSPQHARKGQPTIVLHPESVALKPGSEPSELRCQAIGEEPLCYQWYMNGNPIHLAVSSSLLLSDHDPQGGDKERESGSSSSSSCVGVYACSVSNHYGACWSRKAMVMPCRTSSQGSTHSPEGRMSHGSGSHDYLPTEDSAFMDSFPVIEGPVSSYPPAGVSSNSSPAAILRSQALSPPQLLTGACNASPVSTASTPLVVQHPPAMLRLSSGSQLQLLCKAAAASAHEPMLAFQWYHVNRDLETRPLEAACHEQLDMTVDSTACSGSYYCRVTSGRQSVFSRICNVVVHVDDPL